MSSILCLKVFVVVVKFMQHKHPEHLPEKLKDWKFLPIWFRSLKPYDSFIRQYLCCFKCCRKLVIPSSSFTSDFSDPSIADLNNVNEKKAEKNADDDDSNRPKQLNVIVVQYNNKGFNEAEVF
jgi:hypothetical protein